MKVPFTLFQIALSAIAFIVLLGCIGCDCAIMFLARSEYGSTAIVANAVFSAVVLLLSVIFIYFPSITHIVQRSEDTNSLPALTAARTYVCFLALDAAAVLGMMLFGAVFDERVEKYILIAAPAIFLLGVIKYVFDIRRIGIAEAEAEEKTENEAEAAMSAEKADEQIQEGEQNQTEGSD